MGLNRTKILIVDDNHEAGIKLADAIWQNGWPALFVHYTEEKLISGEYGLHKGVRAVFLDIELTAGGLSSGGSNLYSQAETALRRLLDEENGPYALITYSSFDKSAQGLYQHLMERLPDSIKPITFSQMDKEDLLGDSPSAAIKDVVQKNISRHDAVRCVTEWEGNVKNSASTVVATLAKIAISAGDDINSNLNYLLLQLARAEAGKWLNNGDDIAGPLYNILSPLLNDRLSYIKPSSYTQTAIAAPASVPSSWQNQINTWLHLDCMTASTSSPGSLFSYPIDRNDISLPYIKNAGAAQSCIRGNFLTFHSELNDEDYKKRKEISKKCELFAMDITPPCDHSNKKITWRRFMMICKIPVKHINCLWVLTRNEQGVINRQPEKTSDNLKISPPIHLDGEDWVLVFNANLQGGIAEPSDSNWTNIFGETKLRVREQLLRDIMGWMGRHITRSGIVSMA